METLSNDENETEWVSTRIAAEMMGLSRARILGMCAAGDVRSERRKYSGISVVFVNVKDLEARRVAREVTKVTVRIPNTMLVDVLQYLEAAGCELVVKTEKLRTDDDDGDASVDLSGLAEH